MCTITVSGYKMNDGTLIPFKELNLQNIPVQHIDELNKASATAWDIVLLRNSLEEMKETIIQANTKHAVSCPINKNAVAEIVQQEIKKIPAKTFSAGAKFADSFTKILVLLLTIITIWNFFK